MFPDTLADNLDKTLLKVSDLRERARGTPAEVVVEQLLEALFGASCRLAAYGTLRPGESNHHWLEGIEGTWQDGFVLGSLGEANGYPILRLDPKGERIPVGVFVSPGLPHHWRRLDWLEGSNYRRSLCAVHGDKEGPIVANIYEAC